MNKKKRLLSLGLACILSLSLMACGGKQEEASEPSKEAETSSASEQEVVKELDWLNTESMFPVVKEGTEKTLTIYVCQDPAHGEPEESWVYRYLTDQTNINLEFVPFYDENRDEVISLAFASGELPDIIIGAKFSTAELMKYGASNEQILDLSPYINETYMPNLSGIYADYPEFKASVTDAEGKVWSLGHITNPSDRGNVDRAFINYEWLEQCGLEVPTTLDEFVDAMRAFKEAGLSEYPLGGSYTLQDPSNYIMNALGYLCPNMKTKEISIRHGEVVLPYADREAFGEYLKVMNQMYQEGLIHPDFYTMDSLATQAALSEGVGFVNWAPYIYMKDTFKEYWAATPLTSSVNDTAQWTANNPVNFGNAVVTSACEEPELAVKFLDCLYDMDPEMCNYIRCWSGAKQLLTAGDETDEAVADLYQYGDQTELVRLENGTWNWKNFVENQDSYSSGTDYAYKHLNIWKSGTIGCLNWSFVPGNKYQYYGEQDWTTFDNTDELRAAVSEMNSGEKSFRVAMQIDQTPYVTSEVFPNAVYFDETKATELLNQKTAMDEYAEQEIAKFVTGARPLTEDELNKYFDALEGLGALDYVQAYAEYYESVK